MDSLYPSLLSSVALCFLAFVRPLENVENQGLPMRTLLLTASIYLLGLFIHAIYPATSLSPYTVTMVCSLVSLCVTARRKQCSGPVWLGGMSLALITGQIASRFPFHSWHGLSATMVGTVIWFAALWLVARSRADAERLAGFTVLFLFLLSIDVRPDLKSLAESLWNVPFELLANTACNLYWCTILVYNVVFYIQKITIKVWLKRYKPII